MAKITNNEKERNEARLMNMDTAKEKKRAKIEAFINKGGDNGYHFGITIEKMINKIAPWDINYDQHGRKVTPFRILSILGAAYAKLFIVRKRNKRRGYATSLIEFTNDRKY